MDNNFFGLTAPNPDLDPRPELFSLAILQLT